MALRLKDKRAHYASHDLIVPSSHVNRRRKSLPKITPEKDHLPPLNSRMVASHPTKQYKPFDLPSEKPQIIVVACQHHPEELIKFIDMSTNLFGPHCEMCIVTAGSNLRQMQLERVNDIHARLNKLLKTQADHLKTLEQKVDSMSKDIKITNAALQPVMAKIDYMEKKASAQLENLFKRLRQKYTKANPFKHTKDEIEKKLEEIEEKMDELAYQDKGTLEFMRNMLKTEPKMKEEMRNFVIQIKSKLESSKDSERPSDREIGNMENAFDEFMDHLESSCEKFAHIVLR